MKKLSLLIGLFAFLPSFVTAARRVPAAAQRRLEKIKAAKKGKKPKKAPAHRARIKRNLGFVRHMPNKVIRLTTNPNEGFLVNAQGQRYPVVISDTKEKTGFYIGAFYDLDSWNLRYVYLK